MTPISPDLPIHTEKLGFKSGDLISVVTPNQDKGDQKFLKFTTASNLQSLPEHSLIFKAGDTQTMLVMENGQLIPQGKSQEIEIWGGNDGTPNDLPNQEALRAKELKDNNYPVFLYVGIEDPVADEFLPSIPKATLHPQNLTLVARPFQAMSPAGPKGTVICLAIPGTYTKPISNFAFDEPIGTTFEFEDSAPFFTGDPPHIDLDQEFQYTNTPSLHEYLDALGVKYVLNEQENTITIPIGYSLMEREDYPGVSKSELQGHPVTYHRQTGELLTRDPSSFADIMSEDIITFKDGTVVYFKDFPPLKIT